MKVLEDNIDLIKKTVLDVDCRFIDLNPLTARVHLKLPSAISLSCTRAELSNFILSHCFEWGISVQNGHRLLLTENVVETSGVNDIVVECSAAEIKLLSGSQLIDSVIEQCGFANAYDAGTGDIIILTKDREGKLIKSETSFWPDSDLDADLDVHE